jgi:uncharacterized protein (DUF2384 family)
MQLLVHGVKRGEKKTKKKIERQFLSYRAPSLLHTLTRYETSHPQFSSDQERISRSIILTQSSTSLFQSSPKAKAFITTLVTTETHNEIQEQKPKYPNGRTPR